MSGSSNPMALSTIGSSFWISRGRPTMDDPQRLPAALASRAKALEELGLQEVAWTKADALELVAQLAGCQVAVLGGDVYNMSSGRVRPSYENWSCERRSGEGLRGYAERSQQEAVAFLRAYPELPDVLFTLVLSQNETAGL